MGDVAGLGFDAKFRIVGAALGTDDGAVIEEVIGDLHRRIEHAAGIVAQIDDEALESPGARVLELGHGLLQLGGGGVGEASDAQVAEIRRQQLGLHALQLHVGALHLEFEQRRGAVAPHREPDRTAFGSAHACDGRVQVGRVDRHAVDADDDVAGCGSRHARPASPACGRTTLTPSLPGTTSTPMPA